MLSQAHTALIERLDSHSGDFEAEPYEVAWAHEALVFIKTLGNGGGATLEARVQISPNGIDWVDEGSAFPTMKANELRFLRITNFGTWLRVVGSVNDGSSTDSISVLVYLALKQ